MGINRFRYVKRAMRTSGCFIWFDVDKIYIYIDLDQESLVVLRKDEVSRKLQEIAAIIYSNQINGEDISFEIDRCQSFS